MNDPRTLRIADWSITPGARYRSDGQHSGEEYRDTILALAYEQAVADDVTLLIDLDGGYGYAPGFLEEAFGGLARRYDAADVAARLKFKSDDEPHLLEDIEEYIADCYAAEREDD